MYVRTHGCVDSVVSVCLSDSACVCVSVSVSLCVCVCVMHTWVYVVVCVCFCVDIWVRGDLYLCSCMHVFEFCV